MDTLPRDILHVLYSFIQIRDVANLNTVLNVTTTPNMIFMHLSEQLTSLLCVCSFCSPRNFMIYDWILCCACHRSLLLKNTHNYCISVSKIRNKTIYYFENKRKENYCSSKKRYPTPVPVIRQLTYKTFRSKRSSLCG